MDVKTKRSETRTTVNIEGDVFNDITDPILVRFASFEKVDGKLMHLVNGTSSVCNVMSRFMSHPILKYVLEELMKASNIPMACPIKKVCFVHFVELCGHKKLFTGKLSHQRVYFER